MQVNRAKFVLNSNIPTYERSYHESKHPPPLENSRDIYVNHYQQAKSRLRGTMSDKQIEARVQSFIATYTPASKDGPSSSLQQAAQASPAPMSAWLVTPRRLSAFQDVEI